jgi:NADPH-dependent F420 reductase
MRIAVIGAGNVGGTLGTRWARNGHEVVFGVLDPAAPELQALLQAAGPTARATGVLDAATWAEIVVLAVPWSAAQAAARQAGNLGGKILVDCTNPISPDYRSLSVSGQTSAGEQVAGWARGARVVKAFNTTGVQNMANPAYGPVRLTLLICGDDAEAKNVVRMLALELGFDPVDAGPLYAARFLEPLAMLWIHLAHTLQLGQDIALQLIRR